MGVRGAAATRRAVAQRQLEPEVLLVMRACWCIICFDKANNHLLCLLMWLFLGGAEEVLLLFEKEERKKEDCAVRAVPIICDPCTPCCRSKDGT